MIGGLFCDAEFLLFYDECTFSMNDFKRKFWTGVDDSQILHLKNPNLRIKLNVVISKRGVESFQLTTFSHRKEDVFAFITRSMAFLSRKTQNSSNLYLVLDNSPKNRWKKLFNAAKDSSFSLIFITPGSPEENMSENFFFFVKAEFANLKNLIAINQADNSAFEMFKCILQAMQTVTLSGFQRIMKLYLPGLEGSIKSSMLAEKEVKT